MIAINRTTWIEAELVSEPETLRLVIPANWNHRSATPSRTYRLEDSILARVIVVLATCVALIGCGDSFCVEQRVTISQGLYGRVMYHSDVSPDSGSSKPVSGQLVNVLDAPGGNIVASGSSDADGVFQIELDTGSYAACFAGIAAYSCKTFDVSQNRLVRFDLHQSFGAYWSEEARSDCAD